VRARAEIFFAVFPTLALTSEFHHGRCRFAHAYIRGRDPLFDLSKMPFEHHVDYCTFMSKALD
jgi:hypothetical protein